MPTQKDWTVRGPEFGDRSWSLTLTLPEGADDQRIPDELWDLITIVLMVYDASTHIQTSVHSSLRTPNTIHIDVPVFAPEFWQRDGVQAELAAILRYFGRTSMRMNTVPYADGSYCSYRIQRAKGVRSGPSVQPVTVQAFTPDADALASLINARNMERTRLLVTLGDQQPREASWWQLIDPDRSQRAQGLFCTNDAILQRRNGRSVASRGPYPLVHLLVTIAVGLALDCDSVSLPRNGIEFLQIPMLTAGDSYQADSLHLAVTNGVERLLSRIIARPYEITNPLLWHTPAQIAGVLLSETPIPTPMGRVLRTQHLLGYECESVSQRLARCLATLRADLDVRALESTERQEILHRCTEPLDSGSVRAYVERIWELSDLLPGELRGRLRQLQAGLWLSRKNWIEKTINLIDRYTDETVEALTVVVRECAESFVRRTVPFHSLAGTALLPKLLEPFHQPTFQLRGEMWAIWFQVGDPIYILPSLGSSYIHFLLGHPHEPISALELRSRLDGVPMIFSGKLDAIDEEGIKVYRKRLEQLQQKLSVSNKDNNLAKHADYHNEIVEIEAELRRRTSYGNKPRDDGELERARRSVSNAIHRTLNKFRNLHPELHRYFSSTIRIGTYLSYQPLEILPWRLD